jgi:predicted PurR-regulated permease PerM
MKKILGDPVIKFFITAIGLVVIFSVLKELQHIFIPFVIAYLLYFIFEPLNKFLRKYKFPQGVTILLDLIIIVGFIWLISNVIISSFGQFGEELPIYEQKLNHLIRSTADSLGISDEYLLAFQFSELISTIDYGGLASGFFSSTLSFVSTVFFVLFFFIFISSGHKNTYEAIKKRYVSSNIEQSIKKIKKTVKQHEGTELDETTRVEKLKTHRGMIIEKTFKDITQQIQRYISTKFLISLLTGVVTGIILYIFGVEFFVVWAVLTFLLNFIPNIGSAIAVVLPTLMTLLQFESFGYALIVGAVIIVVQNIIGNVLEPKIMGSQLGLNPIVILLSLLLWGYIWGIVGMFLSVPLTAVLKIIISGSSSKNLQFLSDIMGNESPAK